MLHTFNTSRLLKNKRTFVPMGTNYAPLLADLFLYSYESEFLDNMIRGGHRKLAGSFNLCYQYIDDF